jgi:hypothetical protein
MQLVSIDYDAAGRSVYLDPTLHWTAPWTDLARYDDTGALNGWERMTTTGEAFFVLAGPGAYAIDRSDRRRPTLVPDPQ